MNRQEIKDIIGDAAVASVPAITTAAFASHATTDQLVAHGIQHDSAVLFMIAGTLPLYTAGIRAIRMRGEENYTRQL